MLVRVLPALLLLSTVAPTASYGEATPTPRPATTPPTSTATAPAPRENKVTDEALRQTLLAILLDDQKYRLQLEETEKKFGRDATEVRDLWAAINATDAANRKAVTRILDERGWVGPDVVGHEANGALFLVIQHSDLELQKKYLPMMRAAAKDGRAKPSSLALLEDRVALREGRPQVYGSQIIRLSTGPAFIDNLADPDRVDERRAAVGLGPIAAYAKRFDIEWNVETYKKEQAARDAAKARK